MDLQTTVSSLNSQLSSHKEQLEAARLEVETEKAQVLILREEMDSKSQKITGQTQQMQALELQSTTKTEENRKLVQCVDGIKAQCTQLQELAQAKEKVSFSWFNIYRVL